MVDFTVLVPTAYWVWIAIWN